jgi:hypothetical protein
MYGWADPGWELDQTRADEAYLSRSRLEPFRLAVVDLVGDGGAVRIHLIVELLHRTRRDVLDDGSTAVPLGTVATTTLAAVSETILTGEWVCIGTSTLWTLRLEPTGYRSQS